MHCALVDPLLRGLLGLHLETTTNSVEWVRRIGSTECSSLCAGELGSDTLDAMVILELLGDGTNKGVVYTEVGATEWDDPHHRHTKPIVQREETLGALGCLHEAVGEAIECTLTRANIRCETGTGIIQRVHDAEGPSTSKATRSHVYSKELPEVRLGAEFGEPPLDGVLEGKVEGLGGEVAQDVDEVATPEGKDALLSTNTGEELRMPV